MSSYPIVSETTEAGTPLPWERQCGDGETSRQFEGFSYRDANPSVRSLAKVARELGYSKSYAERLSRQHHWVQRAAEWDEERDRQRQTRLLDHLEAIEKHHLEIADLALKTISKRLENLDPEDLPIAQIPRLLEAVVRVQELLVPVPAELSQRVKLCTPVNFGFTSRNWACSTHPHRRHLHRQPSRRSSRTGSTASCDGATFRRISSPSCRTD